MQNILVVGGAGYIGSHMCKYLFKHGYSPVVLDNLIRGHGESVKWGPLIEGAASDVSLLRKVFSEYRIKAVMHFAALAYVGESVDDPLIYYQNNVSETIYLLQQMVESRVSNFIF